MTVEKISYQRIHFTRCLHSITMNLEIREACKSKSFLKSACEGEKPYQTTSHKIIVGIVRTTRLPKNSVGNKLPGNSFHSF